MGDYLPRQLERIAGKLGHRPLPGAIALQVVGEGSWSLRVEGSGVRIDDGLAPDRVLTLTCEQAGFERLVLDSLGASTSEPGPILDRLLRFPAWEAETLELVRGMQGRILVRVVGEPHPDQVLISLGMSRTDFEDPECIIECQRVDLDRIRQGTVQPMELFLAGGIRLSGKAELALALAGLIL